MLELTYRENGDHLIPNLILHEPADPPVGKYGHMRRWYLKECRPVLYSRLILNERLYSHLAEIDKAANRRIDLLMPQLAKAAGVTEELKANAPMAWVRRMNVLKAQVEEIILHELIME